MISTKEARKIMGGKGTQISDEELKKIIEFITALSERIIRCRSE